MDKYKVFLEKCSATNISGDIATALWALFVQLPFNLFSFILQLLVYVLKVLNIGSVLTGLQSSMIETSQNVFTTLIGGTNTFIGSTSFVGLAVLLMSGFLLYQFTNGKGQFLSSLIHFACVFALVFFYFGTFTSSEMKAESGGRFLFQTVQNVTNTAQSEITKALNPTIGSTDPTKVFTTTLKDTANTINTGNVNGKLKDGKNFDYDKASGSEGVSYLSELSGDNEYLQANNDVLVQKISFGVAESLDAYVMVLPMAVVEVLISVLNLVLLVLILLFPLTAALSFFPFFRNAAMQGLKKMILLTALPAGLSILLAIVLYLLGQVDAPVAQAVTVAKVPPAFSFLVTLIVTLLLKAVLLYGLWRYRESLLDFLTGGVISEQGLGNQIRSGLKHGLSGLSTAETLTKEAVTGTVLFGAGTAMMAGGALASQAGNAFGQEDVATSFSEFAKQGASFAGEGLEHFIPEGLKKKVKKDTQENDQEGDVSEESERSFNHHQSPQDLSSGEENPSLELNETIADTAGNEQARNLSEEGDIRLLDDHSMNPFVLVEDEAIKKEDNNSSEASELSPTESDSSEVWTNPVSEEEQTGDWDGAIQDLNEGRES